MKVLFENKAPAEPDVSIILLDWSCRESHHALDYLNRQTAPRESYEIIWIEYYSKRANAIADRLEDAAQRGRPPVLDRWIALEMPDGLLCHKHLMYNMGIIESRGRIVCFCDSDAIFKETFVDALLNGFKGGADIVLHMDEVRNNRRGFYPFNNPDVEDVLKGACNWTGAATGGVSDARDPLHARNYGACMAARRDDLIGIGGADEHIDYLGHICGPYEMTFRLVNAGRREAWHRTEFLYHVWHPGADGSGNYMGPHDGRNMSTTALDARRTGRIMPLEENPGIRLLRLDVNRDACASAAAAMTGERMKRWRAARPQSTATRQRRLPARIRGGIREARLSTTLFKMSINRFIVKLASFLARPRSYSELPGIFARAFGFLENAAAYNSYAVERCKNCIKRLGEENVREFAVCGTGDVAELLYRLAKGSKLRINAVYGPARGQRFFEFTVLPFEDIKDYGGRIVVASLAGVEELLGALKTAGITHDRIELL